VVSLACSNTEIVCALGCSHLLVGVDDHSDFPEDVVSRLPRVGPDLEIDIDRVAALEPDLVLATLTVPGHETVVEGLELAGLPFIAPAPESVEDVYQNIGEISGRLGVPGRGRKLVDSMKEELVPPHPAVGPSILVQWWPKPTIAPGRRSWTHDVIEAAGGRNVLGHADLQSRPLTDDEVVALDPDAIVISWCGVEPSKYRPDVVLDNAAWKDVSAVRDGRVYAVPEGFLGRPGPRLVNGVRALRAIVDQIQESRTAR